MSLNSLTSMDIAPPKIDSEFEEILWKASEGKDLDAFQVERLLRAEGKELRVLIQVADKVRRQRVGDIVTYVVNRNINFTNVCIGACRFCAFSRSPGAPDAYVLGPKEIAEKAREAVEFGATEVCMQGGLHPDFTLDTYVEMLKAVRRVSSDIHIHAFSPAELDHVAVREGLSVEKVIGVLKDSGLGSVPGTAAEIFAGRVREIICPNKIDADRWIEIIRTCHNLGVPSTATMLYATVETPQEEAQHLITIRDLQRETGGFTEFVPLGFMLDNTALERMHVARRRVPVDDFRVHATARLVLASNIDNIQVSWVKLGPRLAQAMLHAGANDFSGTLMEENISREAGGTRFRMFPREIENLIEEAGRVPRQRTTTYEIV